MVVINSNRPYIKMMTASKPCEERKKAYIEIAWINYQIAVAENKLEAASLQP